MTAQTRKPKPKPESKTKPQAWKTWYAGNKDDYLERQREKYHSDPKFRAKAIKRASQSNDRRDEYWKKSGFHRQAVTMEIQIGGKKDVRQLFPISWVADAIGRQVQLLRHWERNGTLPQTPYRISRAGREYRFYTAEMMGAVKNVVMAVVGEAGEVKKMGKQAKNKLADQIEATWAKLGVALTGRSRNGRETGGRRKRNG